MELEATHFPFYPPIHETDHYHLQCTLEEVLFSFQTEDLEEPVLSDSSSGWEINRLLEIESDLFMDLSTSSSPVFGLDSAELTPLTEEETTGAVTESELVVKKGLDSDSPLMEEYEEKRLPSLLLMGAEAIEAENFPLCFSIISELTQLGSIVAKTGDASPSSLERLAWFFTQGLRHKAQMNTFSNEILRQFQQQPPEPPTYSILQELSPYMKFGHFTANQAILEAVLDNRNIHVIDFDINEGLQSFPLLKTFLSGVTNRLAPKLVVLVEEEVYNFEKIPSMSFVEFFCEAIHHYTALSEALSADGIGGIGLEMMEKEVLGVRIVNSLREFPCRASEKLEWGDGFESLQRLFKARAFSHYNVSQANYLVSLFNGGYWVQHERNRLALCWKSRPLVTASIWLPKCGRKRKK
ncbi:unnamed protein product [Linum tenue]|uniref:Uncharacterized protein n=1 Tax=Linum tenue TaxID=586396 RepID=A0AAV0RBF0_9ROSI|nr:unnamed protein product [Linum tenue]